MYKIFISHCQSDESIVKPLTEMIQMVCGLSRENIFCTSIKGMGCAAGDVFNDSILEAFKESSIVVAFLSKNYKKSEFCMAELGASWVSKKDKMFIPLIDSDIDYNFFKGVLVGVHELKINDEFGLSQLCDKICDNLSKPKNFEFVRDKVNDFIKNYPDRKKLCPQSFSCTREEWDNLKNKFVFVENQYKEACKTIDEKNAFIARLESLKDASEVESLKKEMNSSEIDEFQECVNKVREERSNFDRNVFKFIIYDLLNLGNPNFEEYEWCQLNSAISPQILYKDSNEQFVVNLSNRHVKKLKDILDLYAEKVFSASKDLKNFYADKLDVDFDINNSEFNDKLLGL